MSLVIGWGVCQMSSVYPAMVYAQMDHAVEYAKTQAENGHDYRVVKLVETHYVRGKVCRCEAVVEEKA